MGQCLAASPEKTAYARGHNPLELSIQYQRALKKQQEEIPAVRTQQMLDRHSSRGSLGSVYSIGSAAFNQMSPDERDAYLIERMRKELAALERRKKFLENIRNALTEINAEEESLDSEDENDRFQDHFQKRIDMDQRQMKKVNNFRLKKIKQYNRASLKRVKRASSAVPVQNNRMSIPLVPHLLGEDTREWNNDFATKLSLMRRFYDWEDIPLDFFIDREIDSKIGNQNKTRSLLAARLDEKQAVQSLILDDTMFRNSPQPAEHQVKTPRTPKGPPPKHQIPVGSGVIEIDLSSVEEVSSDEDEVSFKKSSNVRDVPL